MIFYVSIIIVHLYRADTCYSSLFLLFSCVPVRVAFTVTRLSHRTVNQFSVRIANNLDIVPAFAAPITIATAKFNLTTMETFQNSKYNIQFHFFFL